MLLMLISWFIPASIKIHLFDCNVVSNKELQLFLASTCILLNKIFIDWSTTWEQLNYHQNIRLSYRVMSVNAFISYQGR